MCVYICVCMYRRTTGMRLVCAGETRFSIFLHTKFEDNIATVTEQNHWNFHCTSGVVKKR